MDDKITLQKDVFKALASDTRIEILKLLGNRRHTQSEIAHYMNMSVPTIKEHLDAMDRAGLVKQVDEGYKWKYFELTEKSKCILDPERKKVWILLGFWIVSAAGTVAVFAKDIFIKTLATGAVQTKALAVESEAPMMQRAVYESASGAAQLSNDSAVNAAASAPQLVSEIAKPFPYVEVIAISVLVVLTVLLLLFLFRSRMLWWRK